MGVQLYGEHVLAGAHGAVEKAHADEAPGGLVEAVGRQRVAHHGAGGHVHAVHLHAVEVEDGAGVDHSAEAEGGVGGERVDGEGSGEILREGDGGGEGVGKGLLPGGVLLQPARRGLGREGVMPLGNGGREGEEQVHRKGLFSGASGEGRPQSDGAVLQAHFGKTRSPARGRRLRQCQFVHARIQAKDRG